ncbi:glycerate kinase [Demequina sp. SYSU T00192]|uniref:Glycerate kinase n=1 Tax=Demequina litoralis TaxID=3051660 RepID=A0ABT8GC26_9MICO|nr:glycerate kinase [Demequina sp. SYSU T00192]MDN4476698.1 glycerate kinase [Demequina sp. SYSU T00192]
MRVVVAPDTLKGTWPAERAAAAIARGWRSVRPDDAVVEIPQADGGEGTLAGVRHARPEAELRSRGLVTGPAGAPVVGAWLDLGDGTALCELAVVAGMHLMPELDALRATSRGLGEVMAHALDAGATRLVVALGGSASTDGGLPVLEALGDRRPPPGGATVLCDVRAPLLGPAGAAAVFAPQKGASALDVAVLEERLEAVAARLGADPTVPGAGAAGGVGYALLAWGAALVEGAPEMARLTGLEEAGRDADLVVTGEGRFDSQSSLGKVTGHALAAFPRVAVVAGEVAVDPGVWSASLTALAGSREAAMREPDRWLEAAGRAAAHAWEDRGPSAFVPPR